MYNTLRLLHDIARVTDEEIAACERQYLMDRVKGTYLGTIRTKSFQRLVALLNHSRAACHQAYDSIVLDDLPAEEEIVRRRSVARIKAMYEMFYFETHQLFCGKLTDDEWDHWPDLVRVTSDWNIWKVELPSEEAASGRAAKRRPREHLQ